MTTLKNGNGIHPVLDGSKGLREIDLLPNLDYMEMLLQVFDHEVRGREPLERSPARSLSDLLTDLCLTRYYRDPVGQAALALDITPGDMWPGDVEASLWNTFIETFETLDHDEAKAVARRFMGRVRVS